ncbi:MAG: DUF3540 domain-containing protein [Anaeromyxobacter sp.]
MIHALKPSLPAAPCLEIGTVVSCLDGRITVVNAQGEWRARRAVSCLVAPEPGDLVLLLDGLAGEAFVTAVLAREAGVPLRLEAAGDVAWHLPEGRFSVAAGGGLDLATTARASVEAAELRLTAGEAGLQVQRLSFLGRIVQAQVESLKLVAGALDQTLERLWQRVRRSYRFVQEDDHVRAGNLDYAAQESAHVRGRNALVTADQLVKVDGGQVHIG